MTAPGPRRRLLRVAALGVSVSRCEMLRDSVKGRVRGRAKHVCVILGSCSCRVFGSRSTFSRSRTLARCCPTRPAPLRHAGTRAHVWHTHARTRGVPPCRPVWPGGRARPRRAVGQAGLGSLLPGRACLGDALRLFSPLWPPLPVAFGSPPSDSQRWAFSEPPVPFPRPRPARRPRTRVPGPHAQPRLSHAPPPAVWRLSQRTNVALLHLTPGVAS